METKNEYEVILKKVNDITYNCLYGGSYGNCRNFLERTFEFYTNGIDNVSMNIFEYVVQFVSESEMRLFVYHTFVDYVEYNISIIKTSK